MRIRKLIRVYPIVSRFAEDAGRTEEERSIPSRLFFVLLGSLTESCHLSIIFVSANRPILKPCYSAARFKQAYLERAAFLGDIVCIPDCWVGENPGDSSLHLKDNTSCWHICSLFQATKLRHGCYT